MDKMRPAVAAVPSFAGRRFIHGNHPSLIQQWCGSMKKALLALLALIVIGIGVWYAMQPPQEVEPAGPGGDGGSQPASLSAEESRQLLELRNEGLGRLENHELARAIAVFEKITQRLPGEALGWRNLAIARVLRIEKELDPNSTVRTIDDIDAAFAEADATLDELGRREPDSTALHFLRGKLASKRQDPDTAAHEMMAAGEAAVRDPEFQQFAAGLYFAAFHESEPNQSSPETKQLGIEGLRRAYAAAPGNLFIWNFWVVEQAENKDPALAQTLAAMRSEIEYLDSQLLPSQDKPLKCLDDATAALQAEDWRQVLYNCRRATNLIKGTESSRTDYDYQVNLHVLDFIADEFGPAFAAHAPQTDSPAAEVPVALQLFPGQITEDAGVILDAGLADVDLDSRLDVWLLREQRFEVWKLSGDNAWAMLTSADIPAGFDHCLLVDLDDDVVNSPHPPVAPTARGAAGNPGAAAVPGKEQTKLECFAADPDLVVYGDAGVLIFENSWDKATDRRSFVPPAPPKQANSDEPLPGPMPPPIAAVHFAVAADLNLDGDLDLVFGTESGLTMWSNRDRFQFQDVTPRTRFAEAGADVVAVFPIDWDRDVDLDLLVAKSDGTVGVFERLRHLNFRWHNIEGIGATAASSLAAVELDGNVSWDLLIGAAHGVRAVTTRTTIAGRVNVIHSAVALEVPADRIDYWDFDNDGANDLLAWNRDQFTIARGTGNGAFQPQAALAPDVSATLPIVACVPGDLDADGDVDLLVAGRSGVRLWSNAGGNANGWLEITLASMVYHEKENTQTRRVNHYGVGSGLELKSGARYQAQSVRGQVTHFGLGGMPRADVVRVNFTNGFPQNIMQPEQRQHVFEVETPKGSCPFLYTWNGERFVFVTDLCWAAPLGLLSAQGGFVPSRNWEYLLIPGESLRPKDERYVLQMTCELWEADYLDQMELIAVDHPDDVEVYTNEKVGPPEISAFQIHTARRRGRPLSAINQAGRDLLPQLIARDGNFARPFERRRMQGYTDDSTLELDLGPLANPARVKLFLTGWLFPTDTSINVALAENPFLPGPQPPSLSVPDANGVWQKVIPYMGFPGGKTKTIVVDLAGKFLCDDHRVRIDTSMEIYWDEIFCTSGEQPGEYTLTPLAPVAADLHFRGFSRRVPQPHHAPPNFDYDQIRTEPAWAPMGGSFTRYGDVTELVTSADDRMAILAGGDELTVEFNVPAGELPPGWKRDFILHNVGWDKDADLNTVLGQTVEPLPFAAMSSYPYPASESYPDTPLHQEYLRDFQTRTIDDAPFRRLIHAWEPGTELFSP